MAALRNLSLADKRRNAGCPILPHAKGGNFLVIASNYFSTDRSNGTNKVIDTQGTFCYSFPCLFTLSLEVLALSPEVFTLPALALSGCLEVPPHILAHSPLVRARPFAPNTVSRVR
jgi:hypothetical protein